ncbi:MAG TPA: ABC transporter ATP-binding protein [Rhodanobacteraceae bacterium]|nr:ABC transporter ATP-binding protein [Rhodanobacteraceae bacterium]
MSAPLLVEARGLGKAYPKVSRRADRLQALLSLLAGGHGTQRVPVLADVDLDVRRGESVGLVGENGAGKSTLLKLITGVLTPSTGQLRVHGRIGALLELGAGFNPEYTGRENVAMAAALYGLSADEIRARMDDILAFADIGDYINEPVKHYSSGMVVRLGFAVVANSMPDLLITDEVLAVGDENFQKKCVRWIEQYLDQGGTLLLVSHSMYHVQKLCRQACWLHHGRVQAQGDVFDVTQAYLAHNERKGAGDAAPALANRGEFAVLGMNLNGHDARGAPLQVESGDDLRVEIELHSREGREPVCMVGVVRADGSGVYGVSTEMDGVPVARCGEDRYRAVVEFPRLALLPGQYAIRGLALDPEGVRLFDTLEAVLTVRGHSRESGVVRLAHRWLGVDETETPA